MTSERARLKGQEGFTLIEVLVAMVILAVGLLGLEALSIGAARTLVLAETGNELVAAGTAAMEQGQHKLRRELAVSPVVVTTGESCQTRPSLTVCTKVNIRSTLAALPARNALVSVTVTPARTGAQPFTITSYVFDPALP